MRRVNYVDKQGRNISVDLPDEAPNSDAHMGIRVGPPDLSSLKLPREIEVRLHNELFHRGLLTEQDVRKRTSEVMLALQSALKVGVTDILNIYRGGE